MRRLRQADGDHRDCREQGSDHRDDLDDAGEGPEEDPVREPDPPEEKREHGPDEQDQDRLAPDEGAEFRVDQPPRIAQLLPLRPGTSEAIRSIARSRSKIQ